MTLHSHLASLPADLADALVDTYSDTVDHFLRGEPDDAQVDAGRFCEAALRYLEFKMGGTYTKIEGKSKPNRKTTVNAAVQDTTLDPTLRAQVPQAIELVLDFRNNRNSAHLGSLDANNTDAACVLQNVSWIVAEIARIESNASTHSIQTLVDQLARRHVALVQRVGDVPIVLDPTLGYREQVLVLLHQHSEPVPLRQLRDWTGYSHATRFRDQLIGGMAKEKLVFVDKDGSVHLLIPGENEAQRIMVEASLTA